MKRFSPFKNLRALTQAAVLLLAGLAGSLAFAATGTDLADQPVFAGADVPGNLALTLSVEFPTAISNAHLNNYADASTYLGYFDPAKCYKYVYNSTTPSQSYFQPVAFAASVHQCGSSTGGRWSGNYMNWATMQTIDPFRWALSGGYRSVDNGTQTILEKAWSPLQGALSNFPYRGTAQGTGNNLATALVSAVSPFSAGYLNDTVWSLGNVMAFSTGSTATGNSLGYQLAQLLLTDWTDDTATPNVLLGYRLYVRVRVCDATTSLGTAGLESNCVKYGSTYKPEGLMQQYSQKIRYSVFSYLNQNGLSREGGVLREPMGYIGPTYRLPLSASTVTNSRAEWDPTTGIQSTNPDTTLGGTQSGVMNYLNKFGEYGQSYMTYDNVGELYYAAVRYFENLGNVPQWTSGATAAQLDGFPAVTTWADPILYACQKNFILGIGDDHTWYDYDVGGTAISNSARPQPAAVGSDTQNLAHAWTAALQTLEGITPTDTWPFDTGATYYIAGLAYGAHVTDIRSDLAGMQTISTFWMDVMENQRAENLNPYYLATKYGGFNVPSGYTTANTTPLATNLWNSSGTNINMAGYTHGQPDNYFLAGNPSQMVTGLTSAFTKIASAVSAYTSAFALSSPSVTSTGNLSFASQYDSSGWTGTITAESLSFASDGTPSETALWSSNTTLAAQLTGTGWQTARRIATWSNVSNAGIAFEPTTLDPAQLTALTPSSYSSTTTSTQYVNYLRGDRTNEVGSTASGSTKSLRTRTLLLGDIVDATLTEVATPSQVFSDGANPGYSGFKTAQAARPTMVYAAANDGMLHAFVGTTGVEQFAYVPSAAITGPSGTPQVDGLAQLGNPNYTHHYYVDATPLAFDIDFNKTQGATGSTPDWHTVLIGGLGKGGASYYAIDVTNPGSMNSETTVASKVLWEFGVTNDSTMGFSFGAPVVVKTAKYGWVALLTSGYNNPGTVSYLYVINPRTGALLEKVATSGASNGMAQVSAYVLDYSDYTADSAYAGDLNGNMWRFDLTGTTGSYSSATAIFIAKDSSGNLQPITTAPLTEIQPSTRQRFIMFGTGRLLASSDVTSSAAQSFYAVIDGTSGGFSTISTPLQRGSLQQVTDVTAGITLTTGSKGWYYDLGSSGSIAYRIVVNPVAYNGIVAFATLLTSGDACSPSGSSQIYALNYLTGTSIITSNSTQSGTGTGSNTIVANATSSNAIVNLQWLVNNGNSELVGGDSSGGLQKFYQGNAGTSATRLLNWRELPTPF